MKKAQSPSSKGPLADLDDSAAEQKADVPGVGQLWLNIENDQVGLVEDIEAEVVVVALTDGSGDKVYESLRDFTFAWQLLTH